MVRLIIEDATLLKTEVITAHIRYKGGATQSITVPIPPPLGQRRRTDQHVLEQIDQLLEEHTDGEVAVILNAGGMRSDDGMSFTGRLVMQLRRSHGLRDRFTRLRAEGMLTLEEATEAYGVKAYELNRWRREGRVPAIPYNDKGSCLFVPPTTNRSS